MIEYRCPSCELVTDQSICPVCGTMAKKQSAIYCCLNCRIPVWDTSCPICGGAAVPLAADVRPVFPQERLLMEILAGEEPLTFLNESVWFGGGRYLLIRSDGVKGIRVYPKRADIAGVQEALGAYQDRNCPGRDWLSPWIEANRERYQGLTAEAVYAIQQEAEKYSIRQMFVSFSGGKDSTVTSDLVMRALGTPSVIHIYGDTTLEFPETQAYIARFRADHPRTPLLTAKNEEKNFFQMCEVVGPPSRVMRWCCTVFKTGAITHKIERTFPGVKKILSFQGIRRSESSSRARYDRVSENSKIGKQVAFSPVIDWMDYDIWLYLLTREGEPDSGVTFNEAYRMGYTRVGCWCCPNNSEWSTFLTRVYHPEEYDRWRNQLIAFARKVGKPDPEDYVDQGGWKARQGGNGLEVSRRMVMGFTPCVTQEDTLNFTLVRPVSEALYELFRPFGELDFEMGNQRLGEVYVLDREGMPILLLQGRAGQTELRVSVPNLPLSGFRNLRDAELKIRCQLSKYQICLGCSACVSVCTRDAIQVRDEGGEYPLYRIDPRRCNHCGRCISHHDGGCFMRDVIRTKAGGIKGWMQTGSD